MSVLQPWVEKLTLMQQTVLITAVRGPDGIQKDHISKVLLRWYRRCILYSAFDGSVYLNPYCAGGGSFMGPSAKKYKETLDDVVDGYLRSVDEIPHHFQLHFMHAAEILGYCHEDFTIRGWWHNFYKRIVNDAHLNIETYEQMKKRLGDNEEDWRFAEEVTAK
jgi:hypothetical protein